MCATYYARTSDHGYETCAEHLAMAGCLAGGFAKGFGHLDDGLLAGLVHDLGKYSDAFQRRIRNPDHCGPVDHSTAGALLLMRHACPLAAMAVAGHHAGLPDLGSYGELEGPTFMSRMNRARRAGDCNPLALAQAGEAQLDIPQSAFLHGTRSAKPMTSSKRSERWSLYTDMMLTRMLFSALVDADRLDAEFFTSNRIDRAEHHILESLKKHLGPQNLTSGRVPAFDALREASLTVSVERDAEDRSRIDRLAAIMEEAADGYLAAPDKRPIDIRRCELLERCLACGKDPSYGTGLYTLTFTSASTTPARIFPILGDLAAKHMRKTWKSEGLKVKLDKALGELTGRVGDRYPSRLSLEERGAFQLGYYFENQKRFDKANKNNNEQGENND